MMRQRHSLDPNIVWSRQRVLELIRLYKSNEAIWNHGSTSYAPSGIRKEFLENIAQTMNIDYNDVCSKIHNLRCQYNSEIRKIRNGITRTGKKLKANYVPKWEFFNELSFLSNATKSTSTTNKRKSSQKLEAEEIIEDFDYDSLNESTYFNTYAEDAAELSPPTVIKQKKLKLENDPIAHNNSAMEEVLMPYDSHKIFCDYLADQMRSMSHESSKKLRKMIQRAIVELTESSDEMS